MFGQLGDGTTNESPVPVQVLVSASTPLTNVTSVAAGLLHTCALKRDTTVWCWGSNDSGQLGNGTFTTAAPYGIPFAQQVLWDATGGNAALTMITHIAAGGAFTCSLGQSGFAQCWGNNDSGQLGDNTATNRNRAHDVLTSNGSPLQPIDEVTAGGHHACARVADGVYCWGKNDVGQVGDGTTGPNRLLPVRVLASASTPLTSAEQISAGLATTCARTSTVVRCWGQGTEGEIGNGMMMNQPFPAQVLNISGASALSLGGGHACALVGGGALCWGDDEYGQLGDGRVGMASNTATPVMVSGISNALDLSAGSTSIGNCVRLASGDSVCWGATFGSSPMPSSSSASAPLTCSM